MNEQTKIDIGLLIQVAKDSGYYEEIDIAEAIARLQKLLDE